MKPSVNRTMRRGNLCGFQRDKHTRRLTALFDGFDYGLFVLLLVIVEPCDPLGEVFLDRVHHH